MVTTSYAVNTERPSGTNQIFFFILSKEIRRFLSCFGRNIEKIISDIRRWGSLYNTRCIMRCYP